MDRKPLFVCTREDLSPWLETKEEEQENARREAARNRLKERGNIFKRILRKIGVLA